MSIIKICGLTREEDIHIVNKYKPDLAGFVFTESKRRINPSEALTLIKKLIPEVKPAGVFVDMNIDQLAETAEECLLTAVQLHGNEDSEYLDLLRKRLPAETIIIKAVRVRDKESLRGLSEIKSDLLLLDAYHDEAMGGTGEVFDWRLLDEIKRPFLLAGGLNCNNIDQALARVHPYGVDVSSGVETAGIKDEDKIAEFIRKVRSKEVR